MKQQSNSKLKEDIDLIKAYFNNLIHEEQEGEIDDLIDKKERKK